MKFRNLKANEIDVRVQSYVPNSKGAILLLYKDARCDMNILDETVGVMNWQRSHTRDNANCIVSIYDNDKGIWVSKEDTGTESFTEKEKGLASDSFKRACFNWGIGRELYTSPFIWVNIADNEVYNGKISSRLKFSVKEISYQDNVITHLVIIDNNNKVRFSMGEQQKQGQQKVKLITKKQIDAIKELMDDKRINGMIKYYNVEDITQIKYEDAEKTIEGLHRK